MDSTSIPFFPPPPTTVPFTLEPDNSNDALPVANASAAPTHPTYAEMIYKAIDALKEKDGSSKRAIGKYIEHVYKDLLPPTHSTLLTKHLKHLKTVGLLVMVKQSYKLPSSLPLPRSHSPLTPLAQTQRARGRPPKPKPQQNHEPAPPTTDGDNQKSVMGPTVPARRGRPPGTARSGLPKSPGSLPKPNSDSNGLKRRPGRPPKIQSQPTVIPFAAPAPSLDPDAPTTLTEVGSSRPRGRPRKNAAAFAVGRPKGAKATSTAQKVADEEDLRRKLEHFQSKVKESVDVLKPYFNHESKVTAIAAIQELELLASLDFKAPLTRDETQQFPEQLPPQQLPQAQMYNENQYLQQLFQPHTSASS